MAAEQRKVYIVTAGSYSSYRICEVFDNKKLANEYVKKRSKSNPWFAGCVETWPLNKSMKEPKTVWSVHIDRQGKEVSSDSWIDWGGEHCRDTASIPGLKRVTDTTYIIAKSTRGRDVALKIARDKLAEMKAKEAGV